MTSNIDDRTRKLIESTVRANADGYAVKSVATAYDYGPHDTEWLLITIRFDASADTFRWDTRWPLLRALSDALQAIGDTRNPYLDFEFDRQSVAGKALTHA